MITFDRQQLSQRNPNSLVNLTVISVASAKMMQQGKLQNKPPERLVCAGPCAPQPFQSITLFPAYDPLTNR
jgi:hypothetical protein